jgi:hypothetical protein
MHCPTCAASLVHVAAHDPDAFNPWCCPAGHGRAATHAELHAVMQGDELRGLWEEARRAPRAGRACPSCRQGMAAMTLHGDADTAPGASGAGAFAVDLEVCVADQFVWFDAGELEAFPPAGADPGPTASEVEVAAAAAAAMAAAIDASARDREGFTDRVAARLPAGLGRALWDPSDGRFFGSRLRT